MRDSQRSKVYKAEEVLKEGDVRLDTVPEIQSYVDRLIKSAWFRRRWPSVKSVIVKDGRGRIRAGASDDGSILMPFWCRYRYIVLHEISHLLPDWNVADHGPEFCKVYLELVKHCMGRDAWEKLRTSFKNNRVKWIKREGSHPKGVAPPHLVPYQKTAGRQKDG